MRDPAASPRRCLMCRSLNESYVDRCSCGASLDATADESRQALARAARLAGWSLALSLLVAAVLAAVVVTAFTEGSAGSRTGARLQGRFLGAVLVGACLALGGCARAVRAWFRARASLAAIPDLPRARVRQ